MRWKRCPLCEINYIQGDKESCDVCVPKAREGYTITSGGKEKKLPKPKAEGNIAFKCNYCDGGKDDTQIGFAGICTRENIQENILVKKRTWCSDEKCQCAQYLQGKISYDQIDYNCYESRMLIDWKASAGENLTKNYERNTNRKLSKDVSGGLCVLTAITPEMEEEKERLIFGVFLADKFEEGEDGLVSGFVQCTTEYKIKLAPSEAGKILFWNYYHNRSDEQTASWASGLFRYIDDYQCAQILRDIVEVKKGKSDEITAKSLFEKYCEIKNIDSLNIPKNSGALKRQQGK